MKKTSVPVKKVLMSTLTTGIFAFALTYFNDDMTESGNNMDGIETGWAKFANLEQFGYTVPLNVDCQGKWTSNSMMTAATSATPTSRMARARSPSGSA